MGRPSREMKPRASSVRDGKYAQISHDQEEQRTDSTVDNYGLDPVTEKTEKPHPARWLMLGIFGLVAQGNGMTFLAISSISGKAQDFYNVSESTVNLVVILFYAIYLPFMPLATWTVNLKDGLRGNVLVAAFVMALGCGIRAVAYNGSSASFNYYLLGTAICAVNGPFILSCFTLVPASWFPESERGMAVSIGVLANQMGMVVGYLLPPLIVTEETDRSKQKTQFLICHLTLAAITGIAFLLAFFLFKSTPPNATRRVPIRARDEMELVVALKLMVTNPNFWAYGLGFALVAPIYWDMGTLLNQNMSPSGYSDGMIMIPGVLLQAIALPGMVLAGKLIDTLHIIETIIIASLLLALCSMIVFSWAITLEKSTTNLMLITLCSVCAGFSFSMVQPAMLDLVTERTQPVPHGSTCSVLYLGTMTFGGLYMVISNYMKALHFNILICSIIAIILAASLIVPQVFPHSKTSSSSKYSVHSVSASYTDGEWKNGLETSEKGKELSHEDKCR